MRRRRECDGQQRLMERKEQRDAKKGIAGDDGEKRRAEGWRRDKVKGRRREERKGKVKH